MRLWTKVLLASSLATLAWGCTTKTEDAAPPGPKYPDVGSFCQGRAEAECNAAVIDACASSGASACVAKAEAKCLSEVPPDRSYRADQAEGCANAYGAAYQDAKIEPAELDAIAKACGGLFERESGLAGVECAVDRDCKLSDGLSCVLHADATSIKGTCAVPRSVDKGDSCSAADAECIQGYYCDTGSHCVAQGGAGDPCGATQPCGKGLQCDAATSQCVSKAAAGSACANDTDCADGICDLGANPVCVAKLILSPNEPACDGFR